MKVLALALLGGLLLGCKQTPSPKIPQHLLTPPAIEIRQIDSEMDAGLFMLDIYEAYEGCALNLQAIKNIMQIK